MTWIVGLVLKNWLPLLGGLVAAFFGGKIYLKGRKHARIKADKELQDALDDTKEVAARARAAGDRISDSDLRSDDGHKRID
jgi:hypothetical protein